MSDSCEHPESAMVDNCRSCGAPQCCKWCCELQERDARIIELEEAPNKIRKSVVKAGLQHLYESAGEGDEWINVPVWFVRLLLEQGQ